MNILLAVTGSISAYKAASIAAGLQKCNHTVKVMMTKSAEKLISPATLEGITHDIVYTDDNWFSSASSVPHINLSKWADIFLVCPATANSIAKFANGIADNLVSATFTAFMGMAASGDTINKRIIICPAMNMYMFSNSITQRNLDTIVSMGHNLNCLNQLEHRFIQIILPKEGKLACGDEGIGHLKTTKEIIEEMNLE